MGRHPLPSACWDTHTTLPFPVHAGIHPPVQCMLGYDQQAGGTHPTGMHSCFSYKFRLHYLPMCDIICMQILESLKYLQHNAFHLKRKKCLSYLCVHMGQYTHNIKDLKGKKSQRNIWSITCASENGLCILSNRLARSCSQYSITRKILQQTTQITKTSHKCVTFWRLKKRK